MNPAIPDVFHRAKSLFIYMPDDEQFPLEYDNWQSHHAAVLQGGTFKGDCDDHALTCATLLAKRGLTDIRIALCRGETGRMHLVCIADGYLIDNMQSVIWHWNEVPYEWISSMKLSEPGVWRKIA